MTRFPAVDPIPLPAPLWLFKLLHNVTFILHLGAVEMMIGGLILALLLSVAARRRSSPEMLQASGMIAHRLPTVMAFVINLGIPPLLFAQVLYGRALYTSSVLIGVFWISVIFLLMGSYYGLYFSAKRAESKRRWLAPGLAALLLILTISFIYSNNMTLMIRPAVWQSMYRASPAGAQLNSSDPALPFRWLFFIAGSFPAAGAALMLLSLRQRATDPVRPFLMRLGGWSAAAGMVLEAICAYATISAQPAEVVGGIMISPLYAISAWLWVATAAICLLAGVAGASSRSPGALIASASALAVFLNIASTVEIRDAIRDLTLRAAGFDVWNRQVVTNWSVVGVFLVLFVGAAAAIAFLIGVVARARRVEEKYA